jgi:predicted protein tyrosine phosphatase
MQLTIMSLAEARTTEKTFTHLISVIEPKYHSIIPNLGIPQERRLLLACDDTSDPDPDEWSPRPPTRKLVEEGLAFAQRLPEDASLLVHCFAGVSRSVALAYAVLCQSYPTRNENWVLRQVLMLRRSAIPNSLIVAYADDLLERYGRMSEAVLDYKATAFVA